MKQGNVKLLAASAVVVALVLVFSYITLGGSDDPDDSGLDFRKSPTLGDFHTWHDIIVYADGTVEEYDTTYRVVQVDGDNLLVRTETVGFEDRLKWYKSDEYFENESTDGLTKTGTEVLETFLGPLECDVFSGTRDGEQVSMWIYDDFAFKYTSGNGDLVRTLIFTDASYFGPAPEFSEMEAPGVPGVGDWMTTTITLASSEGAMAYETLQTIVSIDGDQYTVLIEQQGQDPRQEVMSLGMFLTGIEVEKSEYRGTALLEFEDGTFLAHVYVYTDPVSGTPMTAYVSNGMTYRVVVEYNGIVGTQDLLETSF